MARTIPALVTEARRLLQDTRSSSYRRDDEYMAGLVNMALQEIKRLRPDAFIFGAGVDDVAVPVYAAAEIADTATLFPIDDAFFLPAVWYMVANAELADDEFTEEGRAVALMQAFRTALIGRGG